MLGAIKSTGNCAFPTHAHAVPPKYRAQLPNDMQLACCCWGKNKTLSRRSTVNWMRSQLAVFHCSKYSHNSKLPFFFQLDATLATTQTQALAPFLGPMEVKMVNKSLENGPIESNAHVVIAFDVLSSPNKLSNLAETVKAGGFVIASEINNVSEGAIENNGFIFINKLAADDKVFYLFRKVSFLDKTIGTFKSKSLLIIIL